MAVGVMTGNSCPWMMGLADMLGVLVLPSRFSGEPLLLLQARRCDAQLFFFVRVRCPCYFTDTSEQVVPLENVTALPGRRRLLSEK